MKLVKHLLDSKGRNVVSVAPDTTVLDAIRIMADKTVGSLLVMDDDEMCGIVTERDYARKVIIKGRASESTMVSEIMTSDVLTTSSAQTVNSCMELMSEKRIRHLPVVEDNRVIGMISIGDLVQGSSSERNIL
jgi:signal-transduction protein with cAMP-binding, CBS, and nucleotidyltransferase domain